MMDAGDATTISSRPLAIQVSQLIVRLYAIFPTFVSNTESLLVIDPYFHLL